MELADEIRYTLEMLKTFDVPHELRMLTEEHKMGCPGAGNREEILAEKFKSFHGGMVHTIEKLFALVLHLEAELHNHKERSDIVRPVRLLLNEEDRLNMVSQTEPDEDCMDYVLVSTKEPG